MLDVSGVLRGTKGRILRLLRGRERTADEIARDLEVTPNGARFHLTELERDGLVSQRSVRRGARKPSHGYSLSERGEALFPRRYDVVLNAVLRETRAARGAEEVEALFRRLGRQVAAQHAHRFAGRSPERRVEEALRVIGELGGAAEAVPSEAPGGSQVGPATQATRASHSVQPDGSQEALVAVEGGSCPFAAVVPEHPEACALLEAFLTEALPGATVRETCRKDPAAGPPRCHFEITQAPSASA